MADVETSIELVGWRDRRGRFAKASETMRAEMTTSTRTILDALKQVAIKESPRSGGPGPGPHFADAWQTSVEQASDGASGLLTNTAEHAAYVIFPTRPHWIRPVHASMLHWVKPNGEGVFLRRPVWHPGTKGNDIPGRVLAQNGNMAQQELGKAAGRVGEWFTGIFV
jgi:hypothetical protein